MQIGSKRPFGATSDSESERTEETARRGGMSAPDEGRGQAVPSGSAQRQVASGRGNDRARLGRMLDVALGRDERYSAGAFLLRQPHLRADIARALPPGEQPGFLNAVIESDVGHTFGAAPRYETLHAMSTWDRAPLLRDEATARAVLAEVIVDPPTPFSALAAAGLARDLPTQALQMRALDHVQLALARLRPGALASPDTGVILARLAWMCTENAAGAAQPAERASAPNRLALHLLEQYLGHVRGRDLREALLDAGDLFHSNLGMAERVFALVQTHGGRLADADRAQVLAGTVGYLLQYPHLSPEPGMPGLQDRVMGFLEAQYATLTDPRDRARVLVALADLESARPAVRELFERLLDADAAHLTGQECGELAKGIAASFLDRFVITRDVQDRWLQRLDALISRSPDAAMGEVLRPLIEHLGADGEWIAHEQALKIRFLMLVDRDLGRVSEREQPALLAALGYTLQEAFLETTWPNFAHAILATIRTHLPLPSPMWMEDAAFARAYPAMMSRMVSALHELPAQSLGPAFDFVADHLAHMPPECRIPPLTRLVTIGLEVDTTRTRSRQLLDQHVPQILQLEARDLCEELLFSTHFASLAPPVQQGVAAALVRDLGTLAPEALARRMAELVQHLSNLNRGVDLQARETLFNAFRAAVVRLPPHDANVQIRDLEGRIVLMPAEHGARALQTLTAHWNDVGAPVGPSLADTLVRLTNVMLAPGLALANKHEVLLTLVTGIRMLVQADNGRHAGRVSDALERCLADARLDPSLARGVAQLQQVVQWIQGQPQGQAQGQWYADR